MDGLDFLVNWYNIWVMILLWNVFLWFWYWLVIIVESLIFFRCKCSVNNGVLLVKYGDVIMLNFVVIEIVWDLWFLR